MSAGRCCVRALGSLALFLACAPLAAQPAVQVTVSKAFLTPFVSVGGVTSVTLTINNGDSVDYLDVGLVDNLPAGLVVAPIPNASSSCGGSLVTGTSSVTLTGGTVFASDFCQIFFDVQGTTVGTKSNTTDAVTTESGAGSPSNTADLVVLGEATLSKAFGVPSMGLGATTTLSFTIANPNSVELDDMTFTDPLPPGLVVASPVNLSGTCLTAAGSVVAAASVSATSGTGSVGMTGLALAAGGSCSFSVDVTANTAGTKPNTTSPLAYTADGGQAGPIPLTGGSGSASITITQVVLAIAKTHVGSFVQGDVGRVYTITVSNQGDQATSGTVTVTDSLPAGLTATALAGTGWACSVPPAVAGPSLLTCTSSAAIAPGASYPAISLTVDVAGNAPPSVVNVAQAAGGGDVGPPVVASDPTTIAALPVIVVPTLDGAGFAVLLLALAAAGCLGLRRRSAARR